MKKSFLRDMINNIKLYGHNSIIVRNFFLVLGMVVLPMLLITMIVRYNMANTVEREITESNTHTLETMAKSMDEKVDQMFSFAHYLLGESKLNMLYFEEENVKEYLDLLSNKVHQYILLEEAVDSVYLYLENVDKLWYSSSNVMVSTSREDASDIFWMEQYEHYDGKESFLLYARAKGKVYPYLCTMIYFIKNGSGKRQGAVVVNLRVKDVLNSLMPETEEDSRFWMLDASGHISLSSQLEENEQETLMPEPFAQAWNQGMEERMLVKQGENNYKVVSVESQWEGYSYVLARPITNYQNRLESLDAFIRNVIFCVLVMACVVAYIVTIHSYRPIQEVLNEVTDTVGEEEGSYEQIDFLQGETTKNELQYIISMVRRAGNRNKRLQMATGEWMQKLKDAQMQALQSQMDPHYLYNTLDMINWDAVEQLGLSNSVSDSLDTLAQFLSCGLKAEYLRTVEEEVSHAKLYVKILEKKHGGSIQIHWHMDEKIMSCQILSLCIQPLIENAVQHGLRPRRYRGNIMVSGERFENFICITVQDDGVSMDIEACRRMNQELLDDYVMDMSHMGVKNINKRIKILFGDEYGINFMPEESGGLAVRILLPYMEFGVEI